MIKKKNEQAIISTSIQISEQNTKWGIDIKEYLKTTFLYCAYKLRFYNLYDLRYDVHVF